MLGRIVATAASGSCSRQSTRSNLRPDDPNGGGNHRRRLRRGAGRVAPPSPHRPVDMLWVHLLDELTPVEETMRALDDQVRLGKVLYVAVSDWPAFEVSRANTMAELARLVAVRRPADAVQPARAVARARAAPDGRRGRRLGGRVVAARERRADRQVPGRERDRTRDGDRGQRGRDPRTEAIVKEVVAVGQEVGADAVSGRARVDPRRARRR